MATEEHIKKMANDGPAVTLTIRLIMQGKEVGSIIGKGGETIKKFREQSGARINISDSSCAERIVTVTGSTEAINNAFEMITKKFEEDVSNNMANSSTPKPPVTLRLVVPASQCGSLIGKGGSKIKEIRENTGASVQVAGDMLHQSTERAVTISGTPEAITKCVYQICCVMLESPPKGATIPYRPKPTNATATHPAYAVHGNYAVPYPDFMKLHHLTMQHTPFLPGQTPFTPTALNMGYGVANAASAGTQVATTGQQTYEIMIPNDLIGCVIGRGGAKINEIRQISGATIKIANSQEGSNDRSVTISGTVEAINLAHFLINSSLELAKNLAPELAAKANLIPTSALMTMSPTTPTTSPSPLGIPISNLLKPMPLLGLEAAKTTFTTKIRPNSSIGTAGLKKASSNKFSPY
uniref:Poly(RC)-binding protein 3-like isoform X1 n=1 Tax=Saccoglossus kowalevskii TaxID=10224 RepID=A0ABM0GWA9_SACKO|nr:PREDICTED: poly(rC)-binding protein 3-like isoform X1 [Saccoglossus kowalevskii]